MSKEISKSTERKVGVVLNYVQIFLTALSGILYTPIMISVLGKNEYGLYGTVLSFIGLLGLLNLGFSNSYIKFYSKFKAKKEYNRINSFNALFFIVFAIIAAASLIIGMFFSFNLKFVFDDGLTADEYQKARIMMILLTISTALGFILTIFPCYISAKQKFIYQKTLQLVSNIINIVLNLVVLFSGFGVIGLVVVALSSSILFQLISIIYSYKNLDFKFDFKNIEPKLFKEVFAFSGLIAINMIVDKINTGIDSVLLARFCGTTVVAIYTVGAHLNNHFTTFSTAISGIFVPKVHQVVNAYEQDSKEQRAALTEMFVRVGRIQYLLLALIASGVVFFGRPFIRFWTNEPGYEDAYPIALILILPSLVALSQNIGIEIQRAMSRHHYRSYIYGLTAILNLVSSYFMCQVWGGIGSALGTGGACVISTIILMNIVYNKKINIEIKEYWKNIGRQTLGMIPSFIVGTVIMKFVDFGVERSLNSILKLLSFIAVYCVVYLINIYFASMNEYEKGLITNIFKKILKKA